MRVFSLEEGVETLTMSEMAHVAVPGGAKFVQVTRCTWAPEQFTTT